jgi:hypothetical protein
MLAEKIDLEKDRDAVHRYDEALRQWHAQVLEVEKTTRSLQTTHDLDPRLRQNEIAAWEENSQRQFHRSPQKPRSGRYTPNAKFECASVPFDEFPTKHRGK